MRTSSARSLGREQGPSGATPRRRSSPQPPNLLFHLRPRGLLANVRALVLLYLLLPLFVVMALLDVNKANHVYLRFPVKLIAKKLWLSCAMGCRLVQRRRSTVHEGERLHRYFGPGTLRSTLRVGRPWTRSERRSRKEDLRRRLTISACTRTTAFAKDLTGHRPWISACRITVAPASGGLEARLEPDLCPLGNFLLSRSLLNLGTRTAPSIRRAPSCLVHGGCSEKWRWAMPGLDYSRSTRTVMAWLLAGTCQCQRAIRKQQGLLGPFDVLALLGPTGKVVRHTLPLIIDFSFCLDFPTDMWRGHPTGRSPSSRSLMAAA